MARLQPYRRTKFVGVAGKARTNARPRRGWASPWDMLAMAVAGLSVVYIGAQMLAVGAALPPATPTGPVVSAHFSMCGLGTRINCVVDGDTFWLHGQKIRIADIDTPEVFSPKCGSELALGNKATIRLQQLLNAGPVEIGAYTRDEDVYGRKLRIIRRDGQSIGRMLVDEGLARKWDGARHGWC